MAATEADDASEQIATPVVAGDESLPATPAVEQDADAEIAQETGLFWLGRVYFKGLAAQKLIWRFQQHKG